ncbi:MAG: hypothetical protein NC489_33415, partial [Ruminococcus flavefaciens]|nr:hypothetical protein [Ruminococcus flavefaciens]
TSLQLFNALLVQGFLNLSVLIGLANFLVSSFNPKMINNIWDSNFNFLGCQILYPIAKFALFELEKTVFSSI